jgi:hypothetical protein
MSTMVSSEAKENKIKSFVKFGLANTRSLVSATLISSNDFLDSGVHFISFHFLSIFMMCFIISAKLGMNLLRKFTFPRKDCTSFLVLGVSIFIISSTLRGYIFIPYFDMMFPNNFPSCIPKFDFFESNEMPNFLHFWKTFFRCSRCCSSES